MKKIIGSVVAGCIAWASCTNVDTTNTATGATTNDSATANNLMPNTPDLSITRQNAYSDLFLDSAALQSYIKTKSLSGAEGKSLQQFYNGRNFEYAWFSSDGLTEQAYGLWNLIDQANLVSEKTSLAQRMDSLIENDSIRVAAGDSSFINTELSLTHQFIKLTQNNKDSSLVNYGVIHAFLPTKKSNAAAMADSLSKINTANGVNQQYNLLRQHLEKYVAAANNGGWQPITLNSRQIKKGTSSPTVQAIKKRLQATGDYTAGDTTAVFSDSLEVAVKSFQQRHGFNPTGVVTDSVVKEMNVPAEQRIQQILMNMNRSAWMPKESQNLVQVNIPAFMLYVFEGGKKIFEMPVIVGKEGTNTMMFSGNLNQVVFSPYWNVPRSIVENEIMPAMKKDPSYLKKKNMEIVDENNNGVPTIRQLPGAENSLGKVKFLFPNSYDIYLHDTPKKGLFQNEKRAFSHGCIRLADAEKMANYLLRNQKEWTPEKIKEAMNAGKEQSVKITNPEPVAITYYTAWVDEKGNLNFREDIYGHDKRTAKRMFEPKTL